MRHRVDGMWWALGFMFVVVVLIVASIALVETTGVLGCARTDSG